MTKEELIQFLKDNLRIGVYSDWNGCDVSVDVTIFIGDEEIASSSDSCRIFPDPLDE